MRKVFISYARPNRPDIDELVEHLRVLGCDTWVDTSLHGGQHWWEEILQRIAQCDTFIPIISEEALNSTACRREFDWAESLRKPVLPVAVQTVPRALPGRFIRRQIIDYSVPGDRDRAALTLAGGLATLETAPPLPDSLPQSPAAPLSYLTDTIDRVAQAEALDHEQQRGILNRLEASLYSVDPEERRGGRAILELLGSRDDLYADVYRTINRLKSVGDTPSPNGPGEPTTTTYQERQPTATDAQPPSALRIGAETAAARSGTEDQDKIPAADFGLPDEPSQKRTDESGPGTRIQMHSGSYTDTDLRPTTITSGSEQTETRIPAPDRTEPEPEPVPQETPESPHKSGESAPPSAANTDPASEVGRSNGVARSPEFVPLFHRLSRGGQIAIVVIIVVIIVIVIVALTVSSFA